ncbi:MAG: hypothetical protein JNM57_06925 [Cyclobacteriaceae bacterium]|nr:hypothetical protein [Cyclobacteriaceae bacterium]
MKLALLFTFGVLLTLGCQPKNTDDGIDTPEDLIGRTIEYQYGESIYHVTFDSDTTLHWEAVAGEEKGAYEKETYVLEFLARQTIFITWGEANGIGVSQVLDIERGIVYNHLLRGRSVSSGDGKIRILP